MNDQIINKPNIEVHAYLERIGYNGPLDGSAKMLGDLQYCHLHSVPYENLDVLDGKAISLEIPDLFDKIVRHRRGGYCFELNALYGWLLRQLDFTVTDYVARFWRDEPNPPPKLRHHVLKVETAEGSYLCDVGVGGIVPLLPIKMEDGLEQRQGNECYKLGRDPVYGWMLYELKKKQWQRIYSFKEEPQLAKDFVMASFWCEHAPDSIFRKEAMLAIRTCEGRNTVSGKEFRIYDSNGIHTFHPSSCEAYNQALLTYFGITL